MTAASIALAGSRRRLPTCAHAGAAPSGEGGATARRPVRLDKRLDLLERRLSEQEALLERCRELLGLPQRPTVPTPSPAGGLTLWRVMPLAVTYAFGVCARLIVAGMMTVLALAIVGAALRLIVK